MVDLRNICRMTDVSAVRTDSTRQEVDEVIDIVKTRHCICASPMPWATRYTIERLEGVDCVVTGVVAFPAGGEDTFVKVATAKDMISIGCKELDMVINVGALKSGEYDYVENDIRAVVDAACGVPVKTIIEHGLLTTDEIKRASEIGVRAGATYIKTGTGWVSDKPTTVETIKTIHDTIGDAAKIKAAGGVRDLDTVLAMIDEGCSRFGLGVRSCRGILDEVDRRLAAAGDAAAN